MRAGTRWGMQGVELDKGRGQMGAGGGARWEQQPDGGVGGGARQEWKSDGSQGIGKMLVGTRWGGRELGQIEGGPNGDMGLGQM